MTVHILTFPSLPGPALRVQQRIPQKTQQKTLCCRSSRRPIETGPGQEGHERRSLSLCPARALSCARSFASHHHNNNKGQNHVLLVGNLLFRFARVRLRGLGPASADNREAPEAHALRHRGVLLLGLVGHGLRLADPHRALRRARAQDPRVIRRFEGRLPWKRNASESQDQTSHQEMGSRGRPSTVPGAAIGSSSWKATLFRRRPLGVGGTDGGGGRPFPRFFVGVASQGWEEALREGAYCTQEKTALKRWGGGWVVEGPPGNDPNHTTYILCFL